MRKIVVVLLIFLLTEISYECFGQEVLIDLQTLPINNLALKKSKSKAAKKAILTLPFFDDFSKGLSFPDQTNWTDSYVLINQTYAINPPTIGVATFDAINNKGELYNHLTTIPLVTDTLTSNNIDLNYPASDSLYLSFHCQPKGLGKEPQLNDSLVVEFYSADDNKWIGAWAGSANFSDNSITQVYKLKGRTIKKESIKLSEQFFKVLIPISDNRFLKTGFKFRFMNYASLPLNQQVPSIRGNGDNWHIDLVYLDKYRYYVDTLLNDITYSTPIKSFLKNYESIPWKHFTNDAIQSELTNPVSFNIQYSNLGPTTWNITRRYRITDLSDANNPYAFSGGAENIYEFETIDYTRNYEYIFGSNWEDSAKFFMESYLITDIDPNTNHLRYNDTVRYTQKFHNYYAYDDGSAENGYGIYGEGSQNGMVAMKFHSYLEDSLKGIMMYFNRTYQDANSHYFKLAVWSDANGKPGNILYQKTGIKPLFTDSLNIFTLYSVDEPIKIGGDFWIGWINTTIDMLNVGFDLNNNHNNKLYYNLTGDWVKSQFEGSLMIRPVFGELSKYPTSINSPYRKVEFDFYPNPASTQVYLRLADNIKPETIRIVNLSGQVVMNKIYDNTSIDISNLPTGIYLFQITFHNQVSSSKKLVIIK
ncbi:MAG: T9SS type A sorting domain-containing protein [Tenuifilaceae bacterium]